MTSTGAILTIEVDNPLNLFCSDLYLIATQEAAYFREFLHRGTHTVTIASWKNEEERADVLEHGFRIFTFDVGMIELLIDAWDTIHLFIGKRLAIDNVKFLKVLNSTKEFSIPPLSKLFSSRSLFF